MLKKNPHMLLEILGHSKMEQISIAADIYLIHLQRCQRMALDSKLSRDQNLQ